MVNSARAFLDFAKCDTQRQDQNQEAGQQGGMAAEGGAETQRQPEGAERRRRPPHRQRQPGGAKRRPPGGGRRPVRRRKPCSPLLTMVLGLIPRPPAQDDLIVGPIWWLIVFKMLFVLVGGTIFNLTLGGVGG